MRLLKIECKKIITHPFLWIVWVTFVLFQLFQIYGYVGNSFMQQNLQNMYTAVLDAGVAPEEAARNAGTEVTAAEKESHEYNEKSEIDRQGTYGESEYREAYEDYRSTYGGMYDNLDMMKILEKKQEMYNYHPKGNMQQFLEDNYRKLQFRARGGNWLSLSDGSVRACSRTDKECNRWIKIVRIANAGQKIEHLSVTKAEKTGRKGKIHGIRRKQN